MSFFRWLAGKARGVPSGNQGRERVKRSCVAALVFLGSFGSQVAFAITISSFTPSSGNVGASVTINGTGFSTTLASDVVKFNGTVATVTSATTIKIIATVPSGATTGRITVTVSGSTATSSTNFTVKPQVLSFSPTRGPIGTPITIVGEGFSPTPTNNSVSLHSVAATVSTASATQLAITAPVGATTGTIKVTVGSNSSTSTASFTVTTSVTSFSPTGGLPGDSIVLHGAGFSSTRSNNIVTFNGSSPATVTQASTTQLTVTVPDDVVPGPISVTVGTDTGTSSQNFTLNARIDGFDPGSGFVGDTVYMYGEHFGDGMTEDTVTVNGVPATIVSSSVELSDLEFVIPTGATTGPIVLTIAGGGATTATPNFIVLPAPTITDFSPTDGPVGAIITVHGTNFNPDPAHGSVKFNGVPAVVQSATSTELKVAVPSRATTGFISIGQTTDTTMPFTVTAPSPARALYMEGNSINGSKLVAMDATTLGVVAVIPIDGGCTNGFGIPSFLIPNHSRSRVLYVPTGCSPITVFAVDTATNTIAQTITIDDTDPLYKVIHSPNGSELFIIAYRKVWKIDGDTGQIDGSIDLIGDRYGSTSSASVISPDGSTLYVNYQYYDAGNHYQTAVIDTTSFAVVRTMRSTPGLPDPTGTKFYLPTSGNIWVIDIASDQLVGGPPPLFDCPPQPYICPSQYLALNDAGTKLFDVPDSGSSMYIIDASTYDKVTIPIDLYGEPRFVTLSPQRTRAYVAVNDRSTTTVVDTVHAAVLDEWSFAAGGAMSTDGSKIYMTVQGGSIEAVDTIAGTISDPSPTSMYATDRPIYVDLVSADRVSVASVNSESPAGDVFANTPFDVVAQAAVSDGASSVSTATTVAVSLASGTAGTLSGGTSCTIPAGGTICTLRDLRLDTQQSNARLTVSATSGDVLTPSNSAPFNVTGYPLPSILGFTPDNGPIGVSVTITGTNFHPSPTLGVDVTFNNTPASVTSIADDTLVAVVPEGATTGPIRVTVGGNTAASSTDFIVKPAPTVTITSIEPAVSYWSDPYTVSVSVTPVPPATQTPTGTITVTDPENQVSCTIVLPDTSCDIMPPASTPNVVLPTATYSGDSVYGVATSLPAQHRIAYYQTKLEIFNVLSEPSIASSNPIYKGALIFFRLTPISKPWDTGALPTGLVTFANGSSVCSSFSNTGWTDGQCWIDTPTPGVSTLQGYYSGDQNYATTRSSPVTHITASEGGPLTLAEGTEICGFDPTDSPAYVDPTGFVPLQQVSGAMPSAGIERDIVGAGPLSVRITEPADGSSVQEDTVQVVGTFDGPTNTGILVNGVMAFTVNGTFIAQNVPLVPGTNTLTATALTIPGAAASSTTSVSRVSGDPPIAIRLNGASGATGFAPATFQFDYFTDDLPGGSPQSVKVDFDGDGVWDYSGSLEEATRQFTYGHSGIYHATLQATDANGGIYTASRPVIVEDLAMHRSMLCDVFGYLKDRLREEDATGAASTFQPVVHDDFYELFENPEISMTDVGQQLGTIVNGEIGLGSAELLIGRDNADQTRSGFPLRITQGNDGVWRISEM